MKKEITLVDNQYIIITNIYKNGKLITTSKKTVKPINEWTPKYKKNVKYWVTFANKINKKQIA